MPDTSRLLATSLRGDQNVNIICAFSSARFAAFLCPVIALGASGRTAAQEAVADVITFAAQPTVKYLPLREVSNHLSLSITIDPKSKEIFLEGKPIGGNRPKLFDGTNLIDIAVLLEYGVHYNWDDR